MRRGLLLILAFIVMFSLASFSLVLACDESGMHEASEMHETTNQITGNVVGSSSSSSLEILLLVKELLFVVALILAIIYLIKLISKNKK